MSLSSQIRSPWLFQALGLFELGFGLLAAFYGPLETYVFTLFSPGGRFTYPGFGMGSIWFAALVAHNLAYYVLAAIFIPLGWATLRRQAWALRATSVLAWLWLLGGIWIVIVAMTYAATAFSPAELIAHAGRAALIGLALILLAIALPLVLIRFFSSRMAAAALSARSGFADWLEARSLAYLLSIAGCGLTVIGLHLLLFLQVFFPMFGALSFGRPNTYVVAALLVVLYLVTAGLVMRRRLALWAALAYFSGLFVAFALTFLHHDVPAVLAAMSLPETERAWFIDAYLPGFPFLFLASATPLAGLLALLVMARDQFTR